jgi:hypothetical protein
MILLETTFLITLLPAWSGNLGKRIVKAPKLFLNDTGLTTHLLGIGEDTLSVEGQLMGPLLENFVVIELFKQVTWSKVQPRLFHLCTQTGHEVDIVMENAAGKIVGIEVKASVTLSAKDYYPLRLLSQILGKRFHRGILLHTGSETIPFGANLFAMPIQALWQL